MNAPRNGRRPATETAMSTGNRQTVSVDVAAFLLNLLGQQQLAVNHPDFEQTVALVGKAKRELEAIVGPQPKD